MHLSVTLFPSSNSKVFSIFYLLCLVSFVPFISRFSISIFISFQFSFVRLSLVLHSLIISYSHFKIEDLSFFAKSIHHGLQQIVLILLIRHLYYHFIINFHLFLFFDYFYSLVFLQDLNLLIWVYLFTFWAILLREA